MQINEQQLLALQRDHLARWRNLIAQDLLSTSRRQAASEETLRSFAAKCIDAARAVHIDEPPHWQRLARVSWAIEESEDAGLAQALAAVLLQEESPRQRLAFLERHLLPRALASFTDRHRS